MEGQPRDPGHDPSRLRISDADRHQVAEVLRQAAGDGRIDLAELDERLEATYAAKTYGELVPITVDLPTHHRPVPATRPSATPAWSPGATTGVRYSGSVAVMSETKRVGAWVVEDDHTAFALMGSVVLDLRQAQFEQREVTIYAHAVMGEVRIVVDAGTTVVVEGTAVMGEYSEQRPRVPFDAERGGPVVRVKGVALMGSVHVQRKGPPGESLRKRLRR
ncbi:DUF1707 domain-containing protein [Nocardioides panacis]|uniref:DUF1707 domain-containing protein n=1 Tax=Nocardioides panacis TaxID=2849501 RepID=A0A975SYP8_9ACTN|nr:DUF1707 domain-containing protein [Nocardioides panacis]QWZ08425.1 DUF1707 domain-containing protein [Nocardioides panacis]